MDQVNQTDLGQQQTPYVVQTRPGYPTSQPTPLTQFLTNCFDAVGNVINDSPYTYAAGAVAYTLGKISILGVASSQAAAFVMIACVVSRVVNTIFPFFVQGPGKWKNFVVFLNTAAIIFGLSAALGITILSAKSLVASAGVAMGVKLVHGYLDFSGRRR